MLERRQLWCVAILVALGSAAVLAWTAPAIPLVWDEGEYLRRADRIVAWFGLLAHGDGTQGRLHALSAEAIREHWLFIDYSEGHPAWFAMPIAAGQALFTGLLDPLTAGRLGPIALFSLACAAVAMRLGHDVGAAAAIAAPLALLTFPRMFAHAHFAAQDAQLTAWWLLLWVVDSAPGRGWRRPLGVGALLGLTCATKFTGWLAVGSVIGWRAFDSDPRARRELVVILPVALLTFLAVNPPLWHAPLAGFAQHVRLNVFRPDVNLLGTGATRLSSWGNRRAPPIDLVDYFVGSMRYGPTHPYATWYNTVAWLALATPLPILALGLIGFGHALRTKRSMPIAARTLPAGALIAHWAPLMIVRALPGAPPNDGIRLLLPAFGFWCVFAAVGAQRVWEVAARSARRWRTAAIRVAVVAGFAATAVNTGRYYPQMLSHYSLLAGGLRGAARLGLEPTFWWDSLDADVLEWLNAHAEASDVLAFSEISDYNLALLQGWGRLRTRTTATDPALPTVFKWYVVQNRPSLLTRLDETLIRCYTPAYVKYAGRHRRGVPSDLNVPLLFIFSYDQHRSAAKIDPRTCATGPPAE